MSKRDPYEVLGVPRDATAADIKSAYRRLARRYHPDVNAGDKESEAKFKEVSEAYSILSDEQKRARFDQFGTTEDMPSDPFFGGQGGGFGDIFEMFFGGGMGGGRGSRARNGEDLQTSLSVTMNEVLSGVQKQVEIDRLSVCNDCEGTGAAEGSKPEQCTACNGTGTMVTVRNTVLGQMRTSVPCSKCHGAGVIIKEPCKTCRGEGVSPETAHIPVNIPPGVEHGMMIHMPGQGSDGQYGGRPGDLYIQIRVADDKRFQRQGQTLYTRLDLTFAQAAIGDKVTLEGLEGSVEVDVAAGTQPGTTIPVRGQGLLPLHGGRRGDMIVTTSVRVPTNLNETQVKLIKELAELSGEEIPQGESAAFLGLFKKKK